MTLAVVLAAALTAGAAPAPDRGAKLAEAALAQTRERVTYDGSYRRIAYPMGDVPRELGVCTDVVIRAYRAALGVDLQKEVHEDMAAHFALYPKKWGRRTPDTNIDHRRVPNLEVFFARKGERLPASRAAADYKTGELVTWMLPGNLPHIGIVAASRSAAGTPLIVHNVGRGPQLEDVLFAWPIVGRFRY